MLRRLIDIPNRLVLDTGPLLLLLIGTYDPEYLPRFKRLKYQGESCKRRHYETLIQYLAHAKERTVTPGVLSEAWNIIDNQIANTDDKKKVLLNNMPNLKVLGEQYIPKDAILSEPCLGPRLSKFGFTDISLLLAAKERNSQILTQDYPLYSLCQHLGVEVEHLDSILNIADMFK